MSESKTTTEAAGSPARPGSAWIVELQPQVRMWIAPWTGDPGRTCVEASAKTFKTLAAAKAALTRARRYSPFNNARIYQSPNSELNDSPSQYPVGNKAPKADESQ